MNSKAKETKECREISNLVKEEENVDEIVELSLVCLNDSVLLHLFSFLDWIDAINLAATCVRLHTVNFWKYKKGREFNLSEYLEKGQIPVKKMLATYGPHINILSAMSNDIDQDIVEKCLNVRSLYILDQYRGANYNVSEDTLLRINTWIKQLNLESLSMTCYCDEQLMQLFYDNFSNLKELTLYPMDDNDDVEEYVCLKRNANVERLRITFGYNINFVTLSNLQHLQCLHVENCGTNDFDKLLKFVKLDGLTEFSVSFLALSDTDNMFFNNFLKGLAEKTILDKLDLLVCQSINRDTFSALKLFNLTTLSLRTNFTIEDFTQFILDCPAARLKHFKSQFCISKDVMNVVAKIMVQNWKNLETICCDNQQFDQSFSNDILKISTNRPPLTLETHNHNWVGEKAKLITNRRIKFCFHLQQVTETIEDVPLHRLSRNCVMKNVFRFDAST